MHLMSQPLNPSLNYSNDVLTTEGRGVYKKRDFESGKANGQMVIIEPGEQNLKPVVRTVEKHTPLCSTEFLKGTDLVSQD